MFKTIIKQIKKTYLLAEPYESKAVIKNVVSLSELQAITYILPIFILPYLFRILGPDKFGLISFAQAFVQYFIILTDYGFNVTATKSISLFREDKAKVSMLFASVMTAKAILLLVGFVIFSEIVLFIPKFQEDYLVYLLCFGSVLGSTLFPLWFFQGTEKMNHIAHINIVGGILQAFLLICFIKTPYDFLLVPIITAGVSIFTGIWGQYLVFKKFGVSFHRPDYKNIRYQYKSAWNVFAAFLAINAYTTTRIFAVGILTNNTLTGFYTIAERIANAVQTFPLSSFSQAIFPRLSKIFQKNKLTALEIMLQVQMITIRISLICIPIIFFFSPVIVEVVCGGKYPETVLSLRLLLMSVLFVASNAFRVQFLLVCGRTDLFSKIHVTMSLLGLPLIILLICSYSYVGAAMATVIIEGGIMMMTYFTIKNLKL